MKEVRVLVVDDEAAILLVYRNMLRKAGFRVDTSEKVEEALEMHRKNNYYIIVTDVRFSGTASEEGLEILRYVREHTPDTRVIVMTGYGHDQLKETVEELGAAYYLEKPFKINVLLGALQRLWYGPADNKHTALKANG